MTTNTPKTSKPIPLSVKIITAIVAAAAAISPFTKQSEGEYNKAYLDPVGIPTICVGHTKGVKMGDVATDAQCATFQKEDMMAHMQDAVAITPTLIDNHNALMAVGDFTFNAGPKAYKSSPMAAYFAKRQWVEGCSAFVGYYSSGTFPKPQPRYSCRPKPGQPGKYLCTLPGLVTRRLNEKKICLGQLQM